MKDAKAMCPGLKIVLADHHAYVDYHHRIHAAMEECLPVSIVASIDEFGGELMANERAPDEAIAIAYEIKETLRKRVGHHIKASIGIAPNRYLAKVACDMQKPDGLTVIEAKDIHHRLLQLKLRDLPGVGPNMEQRLLQADIRSMAQLLALEPKHMRRIWHSVAGEQLYYRLRGVEISEAPTKRSTVGHSHVLGPEWRPAALAYVVAQRLTLKAGSRLRRMEYMACRMDLSVRVENGPRFAYRANLTSGCDNHQFLHALLAMWEEMLREAKPARIKKVSVTLHGLTPTNEHQPDLLDTIEASNPQRAERLVELSRAMDTVNAKYGRDTVVMGFLPKASTQFSGTRIAFTRVPDIEEFHE